MKITAVIIFQFITFLVLLLLAGLFFIFWGEIVVTLAVLGLAIVYLVIQTKNPFHLFDGEERKAIAGRLASIWTTIFVMLYFCLMNTPYGRIWLYLMWVPITLLLLWIMVVGR